RLFGERPGQHELRLEDRGRSFDYDVEGRYHSRNGGVLHVALDVGDALAGVALVPGSVQVLGSRPELHDEIAREVLRPYLAALLLPEADEARLVTAPDDPGVRAADEAASCDGIG